MIDPQHPYVNPEILGQAFQNFRPDDWNTFRDSIAQGFGDIWMVQGLDWLNYETALNSPVINEEDWNEEHPSFREGLSYRKDMTERQAEILSSSYDRELFYETWFQNVGAWDGYKIGGYLVGSLPDPINFIPLGMGITHLAKIGNVAHKAIKGTRAGILSKPVKGALTISGEGAEVAGLAGLAGAVIYGKKNVFEEEYGVSDIGMDMAFAFGAGFAIGNFARAGRTFRNFNASKRQGDIIKTATDMNGDANFKPDTNIDSNDPNLDSANTPNPKPEEYNTLEELEKIRERDQTIDAEMPEPEQEKSLWSKIFDSFAKDPTQKELSESLVDTLENMGDNVYDLLDRVQECLTNFGAKKK